MTSSAYVLMTRRNSSLSALLPGTTGVRSCRVRVAPSRVSRRNRPSRASSSGPWQWKHLSERMGLTCRLKSMGAATAKAGASAQAMTSDGVLKEAAASAKARAREQGSRRRTDCILEGMVGGGWRKFGVLSFRGKNSAGGAIGDEECCGTRQSLAGKSSGRARRFSVGGAPDTVEAIRNSPCNNDHVGFR